MHKTLINEISENHLFPMTLMLEYRSGSLDNSLQDRIAGILQDNLSKQAELLQQEPYKSLILDNPITQTNLDEWRIGTLNPPKRRIAVDQYIKASLASLIDNKDLTKIHEFNQFVFLHRFEAYAKYYPDHPAILYKKQTLTYTQVNARANQLAHFLLKQKEAAGLDPSKEFIIGTFLPREPEWIIAILAIWKAGAAFIAIDPTAIGNSPDAIDDYFEKFAQIISDGKPAFILTHSDHQYLLPKSEAGVFTCLCLDEFEEEIDKGSDENLDIKIDPENLAYILYTSGSTGKPKGVEIAHRGFMPCLEAHRECVDLTRDSIMAQYATCDFDAWVAEMLILGIGGTLAIVPSDIRLDETRCARYYQELKINVVIFTPAFLNKLGVPENFPLWRALFIVGESFDWELVKKWKTKKLQIVNGYGLTETTICATLENLDMDDVGKPLSIGKPIVGTKILIKIPTNIDFNNPDIEKDYGPETTYEDPESSSSAIDQAGEPWFGGISLTRGYRGEAMQNNAWRFVEIEGERYYKSGDKAILRADGRLEHQGRYSRMVKICGKRIELPSIEANLCRHFQLEKMGVAVTAVGNSLQDKNLTTILVFLLEKEDLNFDDEAIKSFIQNTEKNIDKQTPLYIIRKKAFPTTQTKINIAELNKSYFETQPKKSIDESSPLVKMSEKEKKGAEILAKVSTCWMQVIGIENARPDAEFSELGGRSVDISPIIQALRREFPQIKEEITNNFILECKTPLSQTKRIYSFQHPAELIPLKKKQETDAPYTVFCPPSILGDPEQDYTTLFSHRDETSRKPIFDDRFQVYGLKARGLSDPSLMPNSLYSMAQDYALTIKNWAEKNNKRDVPIFIVGWSSGGTVTPEIVNALAKHDIHAIAYVVDSIAPFPFHHFIPEEQVKELIFLATNLSKFIGGNLDEKELTLLLNAENRQRDRINCCFDYLIKKANESHKSILETARIIRLAEHNYIIRETINPIRLYKAKTYLLTGILKEDRTHYWPKKYIHPINEPHDNIIDGNHFEMPQQLALAQKMRSQIISDYTCHKLTHLSEILEKQPNYIVPDIKVIEDNLKNNDQENPLDIPLSQAIKSFMYNTQKKVLLIQGESGMGKTISMQQLRLSLEERDIVTKTIQLQQYSSEELKRSIREEIKDWPTNSPEVRVLILEGYDEQKQFRAFNYYNTNGLSEYQNLKVIYTCRSEALRGTYHTNFNPGDDREGLEEWKLRHFNVKKIKQLIDIKTPKADKPRGKEDIDRLYDEIELHPELLELVKNPLLLTLVLRALPKFIDSKETLTRYKIYEAFIQDYFERGELKLKSQNGIEASQDFQLECRLYCQEVALTFLSQDILSYNYQSEKKTSLISKAKKKTNPLNELFSYDKVELLKASPIESIGNRYQFIHKSVYEYFIVDALIKVLLEKDVNFEDIQNWLTENKITSLKLASNESIKKFWEEGFFYNENLDEILIGIITSTINNHDLSTIGGIAFTLLVMANKKFFFNDFSGVNISGAILDGGVFSQVIFNKAKLDNVSLKRAWLYASTFKETRFSRVDFGELPYIEIPENINSLEFTNDGKSLIIMGDQYNEYISNLEIFDPPKLFIASSDSDDDESEVPELIDQESPKIDKSRSLYIYSKNSRFYLLGFPDDTRYLMNKYRLKLIKKNKDGRLVATTQGGCKARIWELETGKSLADTLESYYGYNNIIAPINPTQSVSYTSMLTVSTDKRSITLCDTTSRKITEIISNDIDFISCSGKGEHIIIKHMDNSISLIRLKIAESNHGNITYLRSKKEKKLEGPSEPIKKVFTGQNIYFCVSQDKIYIYTIEENHLLKTLNYLNITHDFQLSFNKEINLFNSHESDPSDNIAPINFDINDQSVSICDITMSPSDKQCAFIATITTSYDSGGHAVYLSNLDDENTVVIDSGTDVLMNDFYSLLYTTDQKYLFISLFGYSRETAVYQLPENKKLVTLEGGRPFISHNNLIIGTISHNKINLYSINGNYSLLVDFPTLINPTHAVFESDDKTIVLRAGINEVEIWHFCTKTDIWQLEQSSATNSHSLILSNTNFHNATNISAIHQKLIEQNAGAVTHPPIIRSYKSAFFKAYNDKSHDRRSSESQAEDFTTTQYPPN